MSASVPTGLDPNTEAMLRADIEQVLAKYRLQASDVKVDLGSAVPVQDSELPASPRHEVGDGPDALAATNTPSMPRTPHEAEKEAAVQRETEEAASPASPPSAATAATAATPNTASSEAAALPVLPDVGGLSGMLNPNNFMPPELQMEMERQRQRQERDRILKSFTGRSVLLADKKKRDDEKRQQQQHAHRPTGGKANNLRAAAAAAAASRTATVSSSAAVSTARPGSSTGSPPGSRHTAVSLPDDTAPATSENHSGSERHHRSGASIPVFSILSKEGGEGTGGATSGCGASAPHLNRSVSLKDASPTVDLTHTPLVGEDAAAVQKQSILRSSSLNSGAAAPIVVGTTLPQLSANHRTSQSDTPKSAAALSKPMTRDEIVREQIACSRENQRRASDLASPSTFGAPTSLPPARPTATRLSTSATNTHLLSSSLSPDTAHRPSLRELLAAQEKDERDVEQKLSAHQKLVDGLRRCSEQSSLDPSPTPPTQVEAPAAGGLTPSPPQPPAVASMPVPVPPSGSPRTSMQSPQRPTSSASGRSQSARSSIQVCRVVLPSEPKARAEVVEQFCGSAAGQEVLGTKSRYEHLLATQQQLLESRKKDEKQYHEIVAKAVELNQKLQGP